MHNWSWIPSNGSRLGTCFRLPGRCTWNSSRMECLEFDVLDVLDWFMSEKYVFFQDWIDEITTQCCLSWNMRLSVPSRPQFGHPVSLLCRLGPKMLQQRVVQWWMQIKELLPDHLAMLDHLVPRVQCGSGPPEWWQRQCQCWRVHFPGGRSLRAATNIWHRGTKATCTTLAWYGTDIDFEVYTIHNMKECHECWLSMLRFPFVYLCPSIDSHWILACCSSFSSSAASSPVEQQGGTAA